MSSPSSSSTHRELFNFLLLYGDEEEEEEEGDDEYDDILDDFVMSIVVTRSCGNTLEDLVWLLLITYSRRNW